MIDLSRRHMISGALSVLAGRAGLARAAPGVPAPPALAAAASPQPSVVLDAHARGDAPSGPRLSFGAGDPPILRIARATPAVVRLVNHLAEATDIDWHGLRLPNRLDAAAGLGGVPVGVGQSRDFALSPSDTGTFWFHPPFAPGLSDQTALGLSGALVVEEADAPSVDADQVLLLTDRDAAGAGLSDRLAVNGKGWPDTQTHNPGARLRLRLINGSTREALAATFTGAQPFVIAIDGQPSELFRPLNDTLPVGPGARFDIMVDLGREAGAEFKLFLEGSRGAASSKDRPVYLARVEGAPAPERAPIRSLTPNPTLPRYIPLEHSVRAEVVAASRTPANEPAVWTFNGNDGRTLGKKPLFSAKTGSPVTLGFVNRSASLTAFRVHGHVMRLLHSKDDGWEPYWRDSVLVPAGGTYHVAFQADNPGRWLIESPFFDQATRGLRGWFEVG